MKVQDAYFLSKLAELINHLIGYLSSFRSKLFLMSWCPDTAKIKKKMIYSSSFDTLKKAFVGVHKVIQSNDVDGLEKDYIEGILKSTDRK